MACLRVASKQISPTGVRYEVEGGRECDLYPAYLTSATAPFDRCFFMSSDIYLMIQRTGSVAVNEWEGLSWRVLGVFASEYIYLVQTLK